MIGPVIGLRFMSDGRMMLQYVSVLGVRVLYSGMGQTWCELGPVQPVLIVHYCMPVDYWSCIRGHKHRARA